MERIFSSLVAALIVVGGAPAIASPLEALTLDWEAGPVRFFQNDQRYGASGTPYSAGTVALDRNLFGASRLSAEGRFFERHRLILLYAPLDVTTRVSLGAPVTFRDVTFSAGAVVDHRYLFDGWRLSYLYRVFEGGAFSLDTGATLGVRNALVSMTEVNGSRFAAEHDIGPVPALKARLRYGGEGQTFVMWDVDALSTPGGGSVRGGILDTALTVGFPLRSGLDGIVRLRYLAGGADVTSRAITNWAQFAGVTAGFRWSPTAPGAI